MSTLGWLARPPYDRAGSWSIVDEQHAGEWDTEQDAGRVQWAYRRGQSWRGRFPFLEELPGGGD